MDLSKGLLAYMYAENISMRELSRRCNLSHQTIANILKGTNSRGEEYKPDIETLQKLSAGTGFSMNELLDAVHDKNVYELNVQISSAGDRMLYDVLSGLTEEEKIKMAKIIEAMRS